MTSFENIKAGVDKNLGEVAGKENIMNEVSRAVDAISEDIKLTRGNLYDTIRQIRHRTLRRLHADEKTEGRIRDAFQATIYEL